jgi:hypothetical protein
MRARHGMDVRLQSCQMELMQFARGGDRVGSRWVMRMAVRSGAQRRNGTQCDATQRKGRIKRPRWHCTYHRRVLSIRIEAKRLELN